MMNRGVRFASVALGAGFMLACQGEIHDVGNVAQASQGGSAGVGSDQGGTAGEGTAGGGTAGGHQSTAGQSGGSVNGTGGVAATTTGGTVGSSGAGGQSGIGGSTGTCSYPSCLATLVANCTPSGACTQQDSSQSIICYSNGVKVMTGEALETGAIIERHNTASGTCYQVLTGIGRTTITVEDASGVVVGTGTVGTSGTTTFTCSGGQPVALDNSCYTNTSVNGVIAQPGTSGPSCATGTCTSCYTDGIRNGTETDIDCGGTGCHQCQPGQGCTGHNDCVSQSCTNGVCDNCPTGEVLCNGVCTLLQTDSANCGSCGFSCGGLLCYNGVCG